MMQEASSPATLLFIDDEANILAALKRLFRPLGYNILSAESGAEALALMEKEPVDLVISDMRMPHMTGAELLEQIRTKWPEVVRILLTGYSDLESTVAAINRGEIYRYISKPWDDNDIVLVVREALERKRLLEEKRRLEALTLRQNDELKELNSSLEEKVRQRTAQLHAALEHLQKDYFATIQVFANLMELRKGAMAGHSRRVAELCRGIARQMGLQEDYIQTIETAALLHNIGKIGLPDRLLEQPYFDLPYADRAEFDKHPLRSAAALMALDPLVQAAELIRHHREHYDGMGNRSGLRGEGIPLGARILLVASDYDALQEGLLGHERMAPDQALEAIDKGSGLRYDPSVVDAFRRVVGSSGIAGHVESEFRLTSNQLHEGMLLTHDVITKDGMLLLLKDTVLNAGHIREIKEFEASAGEPLAIFTHSI